MTPTGPAVDEKCKRCNGCGQIASTEDGEPWTEWTSLPVNSAIALVMGLVYPLPCPECSTRTPKEGGG